MEDNSLVEEVVENPVLESCVVGLKFQPIGKVYNFDASNYRDVQMGDYVVVETSRGIQLGRVALFVKNPEQNATPGLKSIMRIATPQDLLVHQELERLQVEALATCRAKVVELHLSDVKIVSAEFSLDSSRMLFV
ncbi:MAG: hypothetical protein FIA98_07660 [Anaerolineae bacterium]|nr:hypothetical protein [Anaerolineae bacterium]